ncbi:hypothetical protein SAMN05192550_1355 [Flavobacterium glycines]|uniref:Uncharacterized protein n=1 Tax=Flavobacterium glycines TaxID=551990 RepID=A0A1B9DR56_9FLAO|nr:hypothetical protein [Flavobacterium glycines]OCB72186.1 hypothetical protein FBGL_05820 [Flavobacterium glycines]GEL09640.1 hypothetical protein FGL01_03790 [Flavobacterium glycines]SDI99289.1 hypothetical protein SAMN05192550_1355 [Flavobacterium glycines]
MKNIFNPVYRHDFLEGYSNGQNPYSKANNNSSNSAFNEGFNSGRLDYESLNGNILDGIPKKIITDKILDEFLLAGLLGINVDTDGYTHFQIGVLLKWYQSGIEQYNPKENNYLLDILEENGIEVRHSEK